MTFTSLFAMFIGMCIAAVIGYFVGMPGHDLYWFLLGGSGAFFSVWISQRK